MSSNAGSKLPSLVSFDPGSEQSTFEKVKCPLCGHYVLSLPKHLKSHESKINQRLIQDPISTYEQIFANHNMKWKNSSEMRWKGGIVVNLQGK